MTAVDADIIAGEDYLGISNCNTSKTGTVRVSGDWLNLRSGPSTDYNRVLVDQRDRKSYVKQINGSIVTITGTTNTKDKENPIWLTIQIIYEGKRLAGYSSQRYIDIPDITSISVGELFTVEAKSSEQDLRWECNDTSTAHIDPDTGVLEGLRPGMVLVTVNSPSGLSDSCLIRID